MLPSFAEVFQVLTGHRPREYQERLARRLAVGDLPGVMDVPTGMGKTQAVLVGWLYALAQDASAAQQEGRSRQVALRLHVVVDRRVVVDDTYECARRVQAALSTAVEGPLVQLISSLRQALDLSTGDVLAVRRLRGGLLEEDAVTEHTRNPAQPTFVVGTLDMTCSRLLFRGYGLSAARRPVDAALTGLDSWWVLDEAHLSTQARSTLELLASQEQLLESRFGQAVPPLRVMAMTATTTGQEPGALRLNWPQEEAADPALAARRRAREGLPLQVVTVPKARAKDRVRQVAVGLLPDLSQGESLVIYCNTVTLAKQVFASLEKAAEGTDVSCFLFVGGMPARLGLQSLKALDPYRTGAEQRAQAQPVAVVTTSTLEVGADLDFTHLVTESCGASAMVQRLGRVNRVGARTDGSVIVVASDAVDPVYGSTAQAVAELLATAQTLGEAVLLIQQAADQDALWPPQQVPVQIPPTVLRAYVRTCGSRNDLPVGPWIRELADSRAEGVVVVREQLAELARKAPQALIQYLEKRPPDRAAEGWSLPMAALREVVSAALKDGPVVLIAPDSDSPQILEDRSALAALAPGAVMVIDAACARKALGVPGAEQDWSGCRVLLGKDLAEIDKALAQALAGQQAVPGVRRWRRHRRRLPALLVDLEGEQTGHQDPTAFLEEVVEDLQVPTGWVLEFQVLGSLSTHPCLLLELAPPVEEREGRQVQLDSHGQAVGDLAGRWARALGLPGPVVADLRLAGVLHDSGKRCSEAFQLALTAEEGLDGSLRPGAQPGTALAKSRLPSRLWRRAASLCGVPPGWRHEAASAELFDQGQESGQHQAHDVALVRHLILSHHGAYRGPGPVMGAHRDRPPYQDPQAPQWAQAMSAFWQLNDRYGPYTLALAETVLRLADWEVSRREQEYEPE
ncbi:type I-G CRISPR-associated helicase/endonuclease Cas3g [Actinomyces trachealis]|uniref:type I-G CRISPR-associated helicase/endonuclease Cas3g n=1 Tax=Actinomyces trachealis TaxID=2763540 RepID=UPI001FD4271C|nr:type I-U CRISPR-associated helicase/endonuclease Cas3 [Actinomyces trachealis]